MATARAAEQLARGTDRNGGLQARQTQAEWDAMMLRGRSFIAWSDRPGQGGAAGSHRAWRRSAGTTYVCRRAGCRALVDAARARDDAKRGRRNGFEPGDGCGSPACTAAKGRRYRADKWPKGQRRMAAGLLHPTSEGEPPRDAPPRRTAALWPQALGERQVELLPRWEAMAAAMHAAALLPRGHPL
jgi:hypothetical protein